jgi:hypothetical protein
MRHLAAATRSAGGFEPHFLNRVTHAALDDFAIRGVHNAFVELTML